jgi:hypothetical protein
LLPGNGQALKTDFGARQFPLFRRWWFVPAARFNDDCGWRCTLAVKKQWA